MNHKFILSNILLIFLALTSFAKLLPQTALRYVCLLLPQDLEICKGYVPGFCGVLGHEFVGEVVSEGATGRKDLVGKRVVGKSAL